MLGDRLLAHVAARHPLPRRGDEDARSLDVWTVMSARIDAIPTALVDLVVLDSKHEGRYAALVLVPAKVRNLVGPITLDNAIRDQTSQKTVDYHRRPFVSGGSKSIDGHEANSLPFAHFTTIMTKGDLHRRSVLAFRALVSKPAVGLHFEALWKILTLGDIVEGAEEVVDIDFRIHGHVVVAITCEEIPTSHVCEAGHLRTGERSQPRSVVLPRLLPVFRENEGQNFLRHLLISIRKRTPISFPIEIPQARFLALD